jgi:hypothetical protein
MHVMASVYGYLAFGMKGNSRGRALSMQQTVISGFHIS